MTVAELLRWAEQHAWGENKLTQLKHTIQNYVVLHSDNDICWHWAKVRSIKGRPMPEGDAWIAATALRYDLPLITHNVKDFEHLQNLGLRLISVPSS
jgi:tRNA(fMet)-specific endonuclease VapC